MEDVVLPQLTELSPSNSIRVLRFLGHPDCTSGGEGLAQGGGRYQVWHPPDQEGLPHVPQTTLQGGQHDAEVAEKRNLQL